MTPAANGRYRFFSPAEVIAGNGSSEQVGSLLESWAVPRGSAVALVGDADVLRLALAKPVIDSLEAQGFRCEVVGCVPGEPQLEGVQDVVAELRRLKPAACVGIGGGSTMDVAKLASALTANPGDVRAFLGAGKVKVPSVPTVMVPTTAGTGSEATQVAMLAIDGKKAAVVGAPLMARAAVLDPDLTVGLPPAITAASGLDALSHAFESYLSTTANRSTQGASLHGATLIASAIRAAFDDGADRSARMSMLTGAYWSGIGLNASVVLGHSIAYTIANRTGLPHGVTCSMSLPYCLAYNESTSAGRIQELALALREQIGESSRQPSDPTGIYGWLTDLERHLQVPASLADVGITPDDLPAMVDECITSYPRANNPVPFDAERLGRLYGFLFKGDIEGCTAAFSSQLRRTGSGE
jgi:alcohol dehydrogenase class IV